MKECEEFFKFAAKAGSLEGSLYEREKVEPLDCWVTNMEIMYSGLPEKIKTEIRDEFGSVLIRTLTHGEKILEEDIKNRLDNLRKAL
ncbi:hypothetical protein ACFLYL_03350 [Chloroflexota bacterium]